MKLERWSIVLLCCQRANGHGCAAGCHQNGSFSRLDPTSNLVDSRLKGALNKRLKKRTPMGWHRIVLNELALQTNSSNPGARERTCITSVGQDQFRGSATDVQQEVRTIAKGHA